MYAHRVIVVVTLSLMADKVLSCAASSGMSTDSELCGNVVFEDTQARIPLHIDYTNIMVRSMRQMSTKLYSPNSPIMFLLDCV